MVTDRKLSLEFKEQERRISCGIVGLLTGASHEGLRGCSSGFLKMTLLFVSLRSCDSVGDSTDLFADGGEEITTMFFSGFLPEKGI